MRKLLGLSILTLLATALMLAVVGSASAEPSFQGDFDAAYPDSPLVGQCAVCHTGSPSKASVNSYGSAYSARGFAAIESEDSDGDGVDNITEIMAGFLPGVAGSTPPTTTAPPTTTTPPTTSTPPPTSAPPTTSVAPSTTQPPTTLAPPSTSTPPTTSVPTTGPMTKTYDMMGAAQVTITFDGKRILAADVDAGDGWTCHIDEQSGHEVEVECKGFGQEVEFEAEVEHGALKAKIEVESDDRHDDYGDDDHDDHDDDDHDDHDDDDDDDDHDDDHDDDDDDDKDDDD